MIDLLPAVEKLAREIGDQLANPSGDFKVIEFQDAKDVKLSADTQSEIQIRSALKGLSGLPIIGEEQGGERGLFLSEDYYWVVDPLDGTYNYLRDIPFYCTSIALMKGREPVMGVIYDPNRKQLFSGYAPDRLLKLNGEEVSPNWQGEMGQACFMTGFPSIANGLEGENEEVKEMVKLAGKFKKVRMIGTAALAAAWVVYGYADAYFERTIYFWDVAAGLALASAAGLVNRYVLREDSFKTYAYIMGNKDWVV